MASREPDLWVMDIRVNTFDGGTSLPDTALARVRGVSGIAWAAPLFKGAVTVIGQDQSQQTAALIGVDDATLLGLPRERLLGSADDLRRSGAIFIDEAGYRLLWAGGTASHWPHAGADRSPRRPCWGVAFIAAIHQQHRDLHPVSQCGAVRRREAEIAFPSSLRAPVRKAMPAKSPP